ncbi:MAG: ABC transporter permease [Fimbriimonadaceae bacterium]|nr:ABC transporter permease [Fimbriimonadaceae bacterium]
MKFLVSAVGMVAILALTLAAFGLDVPRSLGLIAEGAFNPNYGWPTTLTRATPLCLTALGMAVAWRAGMYNIGGEGQYLVGALAAAGAAVLLAPVAAPVWAPVMLCSGVVGGAGWASLATWAWLKRGVQLVVSTILLNFVAVEAVAWAVRGPLQEPSHQRPMTAAVPNDAMLLQLVRGTSLHSGVFVAALAVVGVWVYMSFTKQGLVLRVVGANPRLARTERLPVDRTHAVAMAVSGGLCGLAGAVDFAGVTGRLGDGFSQNWGFLAIPVALLGGLEPLWVAVSALYFGVLFAGTENLTRYTPIGNTVVVVVQATAVLAFLALGQLMARRPRRVEETA